ncbi:MAG: GAF domain-containing protein, partial [Crocosphaera sp.]|nr:GAF domain-containing protein [Crocosphaera sp.]
MSFSYTITEKTQDAQNLSFEEENVLRRVVKTAEKREKAISIYFQQDEILKKISEEIKLELGFDFATIQLICPEKKTIETVSGGKWVGLARHYLEKEPELRDIQADIVQSCSTEIVAGWDKRFDDWIYKEFGHKDLVRIFTPILLLRDEPGELNHNWFDKTWQEGVDYQVVKNKVNYDWFSNKESHHQVNGQHGVIQIQLPNLNRTIVEVIGTVEVGYWDAKEPISIEKAVKLIQLVAHKAVEIFPTLFCAMLQVIADGTREIVNADISSLHFLMKPIQNPYIHEIDNGKIVQRFLQPEKRHLPYLYEFFSGENSRQFRRYCPPRKNGLGQRAIHEKQPKFIEDSEKIRELNPRAFEAGIRTMAAFPLLVERYQGVLYVGFRNEHQFTKQERKLWEMFAQRSIEDIRHGLTYQRVRDRANQLMTLHKVIQSLAQISDKEKLLNHLAWNTLNILGADVVTIYEHIYTESPEKTFPESPTIAGKVKDKERIYSGSKLNNDDVPFLLIKEGENRYAPHRGKNSIFHNSSFANREGIKSVAGVLLNIGKDNQKQVVGVMFINYRRTHHFSNDEKRLIEILADSAAIAILNQRWQKALKEIDRQIAITLGRKELLDLIKNYAVQMTGANLADIRLLDPLTQELVMEVWYPEDEQQVSTIRMKLGEGITGWVAKNKETALVNDTQNDPQFTDIYRPFYHRSGSELCVPLLDGKRLIGVLNVEKERTEGFDQRHRQMLETLAGQAVIAIQNVENKEKFLANEKMATQGHLLTPLLYTINSYVGAIQVWIKKILSRSNDDYIDSGSNKIAALSHELLGKADRLRYWLNEKAEPLDLKKIINKASAEVPLPT